MISFRLGNSLPTIPRAKGESVFFQVGAHIYSPISLSRERIYGVFSPLVGKKTLKKKFKNFQVNGNLYI